MLYDVIVIGGGLAGCTAGLFAARRGLKVLLLSKDLGGQIAGAESVENFPGIMQISGIKLAEQIKQQAEKYQLEVIYDSVIKVQKQAKNFQIQTSKNPYETKTLILAFGKTPRHLDVPGEKEFLGRGVIYCAICDGPLFRDKEIVIVGGGNSAFSAAEYMSHLAKKIYLIHRRDEFRGDEILLEKIKKDPKIELILNSTVEKIEGKDFVEKVRIKNLKDQKIQELKVSGVFVEVGYLVDTEFVKDLVRRDERNQIIINQKCETSTPGIFAAGDVTNSAYKQAVIAAGLGATAALSAYDYLSERSGKIKLTDWGKIK